MLTLLNSWHCNKHMFTRSWLQFTILLMKHIDTWEQVAMLLMKHIETWERVVMLLTHGQVWNLWSNIMLLPTLTGKQWPIIMATHYSHCTTVLKYITAYAHWQHLLFRVLHSPNNMFSLVSYTEYYSIIIRMTYWTESYTTVILQQRIFLFLKFAKNSKSHFISDRSSNRLILTQT